jgi:hypothetical protein
VARSLNNPKPGGNDPSRQDSHGVRIARLELTMERTQQELQVQLQRIADMQVLLDRLIAEQRG